jgi:hypothetical protein
MFTGSIPMPLRAVLSEYTRSWDVQDVWVGCSGNFTAERVISEHKRFRLHSNDVSLYTSALGALLARQPFRLTVKPDQLDAFDWLIPYLETQAGGVATLMIVTRMFDGLNRDGTLKDNPYYRRMMKAYHTQFAAMHAATVQKVEALPLLLDSYDCCDVVPWAEASPRDVGFVSYPPFYKGGYEALYMKMARVFDWDAPSYEVMGEAEIARLLGAITDRRHWLFSTMRPHDDYAPFLRDIIKPTARNVPFYVYASAGTPRVVVPVQKVEPAAIPRLTQSEEIGSKLALARLSNGEFLALRSFYMDTAIAPAAVSEAYAVLVDGKLIGCFAFSTAPSVSGFADSAHIYVMTDFAISGTDYPRLSKLVLYALLSKEAKLLAERLARHRVRRIYTTAFARNPVSMKYRGMLELVTRRENKDTGEGALERKWKLTYRGDMGNWTLEEGLKLWMQKHGQRAASSTPE